MPICIRRAAERGYVDLGWLKAFHTFSFANYDDPAHLGFRALRVINEEVMSPGVGFPLHAHQDMEIFFIILKGGLSHQDDLGNGSILRPGKIQLMSAGRGMTHSEYNASDKEETHFLQIWIVPDTLKLKPSYQEKYFLPSSQHNNWSLIISRDGHEGSLVIHQDVSVYVSNLDQEIQLSRELAEGRYGWLQVMEGSIELNGEGLEAGDGGAISQMANLDLKALTPAKIVFFDLK